MTAGHSLSFLSTSSGTAFRLMMEVSLGVMENYSRISSLFYGDHEALNLAAYTQADISPAERLKVCCRREAGV
jgi:hypothetical protein